MWKEMLSFLSLFVCLDTHDLLAQQPIQQDKTAFFTEVGQTIPSFTIKTLEGTTLNIDAMRGKVVFINFWATWCVPCRSEMLRLEKEVWEKQKSNEFCMIAIARKQSEEEITSFRGRNDYSFPLASDADGKVYQLFANRGIPRSYLVGRNGIIQYQSVGYKPEEFDKMKNIIELEINKKME